MMWEKMLNYGENDQRVKIKDVGNNRQICQGSMQDLLTLQMLTIITS